MLFLYFSTSILSTATVRSSLCIYVLSLVPWFPSPETDGLKSPPGLKFWLCYSPAATTRQCNKKILCLILHYVAPPYLYKRFFQHGLWPLFHVKFLSGVLPGHRDSVCIHWLNEGVLEPSEQRARPRVYRSTICILIKTRQMLC